jgi:hypothetical protein
MSSQMDHNQAKHQSNIKQSIKASIKFQPINQISNNQPINQSINQISTNQSKHQSIKKFNQTKNTIKKSTKILKNKLENSKTYRVVLIETSCAPLVKLVDNHHKPDTDETRLINYRWNK